MSGLGAGVEDGRNPPGKMLVPIRVFTAAVGGMLVVSNDILFFEMMIIWTFLFSRQMFTDTRKFACLLFLVSGSLLCSPGS